MPVVWNLKRWLAINRNIFRASELQALIEEKTGVSISIQSVSALVNGEPNAVRFQTMQVICNALECKLSDFFDIEPDAATVQKQRRKAIGGTPARLYGGKASPKRPTSIFPSPQEVRDSAGHRNEKD